VSLKGHVAWIPGGGRGIGRACALALAREGCDVAVSARTKKEIESASREASKIGVDAWPIECDVTNAAKVTQAHQAISKRLGAPDVLVNAAGVARSAPFLKTTPEDMERHWRLNLMGTFHATQAALPAMVFKGWGRVVNIASIAGKVGAPYIASYAASKHAVLGLTRSLAAEFAGKGVTVNAVCPGYVETKMTEDNVARMVEKTKRSREQILEVLKSQSPQHRLMQPDEVAATVVHLCRTESGGINGQAITIDGGAVQW
jgi:NAD(P)-dependent dehydrogenase (short-subunit alcohol dehydrogenase family)